MTVIVYMNMSDLHNFAVFSGYFDFDRLFDRTTILTPKILFCCGFHSSTNMALFVPKHNRGGTLCALLFFFGRALSIHHATRNFKNPSEKSEVISRKACSKTRSRSADGGTVGAWSSQNTASCSDCSPCTSEQVKARLADIFLRSVGIGGAYV